ncbi:hypothetical protein TNCV_3744031 [Trichonephila clavipes]|nr:hypothetical protein TNCV_3744031 [Trichonephila clavipes]
MARRRVENREGSLGYPRFVRPVFTKDSKPLGKRKRSLGYLRIVTPVLTSRSQAGLGLGTRVVQLGMSSSPADSVAAQG